MVRHTAPATEDPLARALAHAAGVLPDQGPIGVFIHHNTLHAYQHLPFHEAVQSGAARVGARPYLPLDEFRAAFARARIERRDIDAALRELLGADAEAPGPLGLTQASAWRALMIEPVDVTDAAGFRYAIAEGVSPIAIDRARWDAVIARVARGPTPAPTPESLPTRHREMLQRLTAEDIDAVVHPELVRLSAGFLDQGQAVDVLPGRERGFLAAVATLYASGLSGPRGAAAAASDLARLAAQDTVSADEIIRDVLDALEVPAEHREEYLLATALALPGWSGMFSRLERHPEERADAVTPVLAEFLAVRLLFERRAIERVCSARGLPSAWTALRALLPASAPVDPLEAGLVLLALANAAALSTAEVGALDDASLRACWQLRAAATTVRRQQVFHEAYEGRYRRQTLDALAAHRAAALARRPAARAAAQVLFCIDEREESIRRAIEELGAEYETFGVAGFFGVAIDYQGLYDTTPAAHCPVVVVPDHEVHETPIAADLSWHVLRERLRARWNGFERAIGRGSRTLSGGAGLSFVLGPLAGVAAAGRVVAPRRTLAFRDRVLARFVPRPATRLSALREEWTKQASSRGKPVGFSLQESTDRVVGVLRNIGLTSQFAPFVIVLGHGSTSLNNPHESAHDCGACGGRRGGANARLFAELANRPDVRAAVRERGIDIPDDTIFVGGLHDTADDKVQLYDLGAIPPSHDARFETICVMLERARRESARERARRFDDAPLGLTPQQALEHVEARASHLGQPRPEYGHCTNAIAVVGRRALTRGLHLDRRAFLISYEPAHDPGDAILERILAAVGPVGAGISLEYYFSSVDNGRFGCGTKLPHNVIGLLGVMNGHQGDLQTGLPLQMVELHEPMRLLLIVDATPESLLAVASRQAEVAELVTKEWVQLVSVHPLTGDLQVFKAGAFHAYTPEAITLPVVDRSVEWHGRSREFVAPAQVRAALAEIG
ncbi:MAG: DUF2309 domain-containing protein [Gemmatimonadaceae bacterium]|nr:DUF2309 domain-containing protein [Gemmatimonadaceae bacterium]